MRPLSYPDTDVFVVCFSVESRSSFENVKSKWVPEVRKHRPQGLLILVGTKKDLLNDPKILAGLKNKGESPISQPEAEKMAKDIGAAKYMPCSAKTNDGVKDVFDEAILTKCLLFCFENLVVFLLGVLTISLLFLKIKKKLQCIHQNQQEKHPAEAEEKEEDA